MSEAKKKVAKLGQDKMEDVKGGIPYDEPAIIPLDDPIVVVPTVPGEDPTTGTITDKSCTAGWHNREGSCFDGHGNVGACGNGFSVVYE